MIIIESRCELGLCFSRGINPLFFNRLIKIDIRLRVEVQKELFGADFTRANDKYYHYCWNHSTLHCENCGQRLYARRNIDDLFSSVYISHIISRGSAREMATDPRNHNILCPRCHNKWENGTKEDMLIYLDNQIVVKELREDYNNLINFY